ncbi:putative proteasome-type protease [Hoeflea marina]|uniref:Putative proteasome-type protease n=1 Tax=Hoeflea marina TaxID=274592 RepID=A0A317PLE4_9HYPH|nr:proteasome-type protease [Hoeflea marina]PWW01752.1 putative proteasome-type protease [Hoeflea marina]
MTYCVGLRLNHGLVFMSDTRTNAGVDNISTFRKMYTWEMPGERLFTLMSAGNLATTQTVVSMLEEHTKAAEHRKTGIMEAPSMFLAAQMVGEMVREVIKSSAAGGLQSEASFGATFIFGGQVAGGAMRMFMIYPEGNFIEATDDNPFFQIGEHKYGKPILVRAYDPDMSFEKAAKLLLVSFDSTLRSNLSVGLPLDMQFYAKDSVKKGYEKRITENDPYYRQISDGWSNALRMAFDSLPDFVQA